jgi:hypothetical protein
MNQTRPASSLTARNKAGLAVALLLGLVDVANVFYIPTQSSTTPGPPLAVLLVDVVLGVITLIAIGHVWRTGGRTGARVVAGSRVASVLTSMPAFFVVGVTPVVVVLVSVDVIASVVSIALVLAREPAEQGAS